VEDRRIKSAAEIAMEKTANLPELTQNELVSLMEREFKPRGEALASKYLEESLQEKDLRSAFLSFPAPEREIVKKAFLCAMCESITVQDTQRTLRAIGAIAQVDPKANVEVIRTEAQAITREFDEQGQRARKVHENLERKKLHRLGISGSAVRPNVEESHEWQQEARRIHADYDLRLRRLQERLSHLIR
jgi:hypothetical protein